MSVDCLVINWNELDISQDTVRRLLKEPGVDQIIVVDNGSIDGSKEYFRKIAGTVLVPNEELKFKDGNQRVVFIDWPENKGPSVARNLAIAVAKNEQIFLIDGDILYVPGTIKEYKRILDYYKDAFCVGQNSYQYKTMIDLDRHANGTQDQYEADIRMSDDYTISDWFPMAWTQYGLFRTDLLRKHPFVEKGIFGKAGYGLEDTWLFHEMKEAGYVSLAVDRPIYYHDAHGGIQELRKTGIDLEEMMTARREIFEKRWGKDKDWSQILAKEKPSFSTRLKPSA
jgi:glycosyltransferase involved in cell wall biosynthesis